MYEGTPSRVNSVHANFDMVTDTTYSGKGAMVMGKLYRKNGDWKFDAIGEPSNDKLFIHTLDRILKNYAKGEDFRYIYF